uniref:Selenoprotein S n=1 Tax=Mola mola TaxID=94237 RepID=A0A3Q3X4V2_MOLML
MEDVEITDVNEDDLLYEGNEAPLQNQDLNSLSQIAGAFLSQYGWYLLVVIFLVYLIIQHLNKSSSQRDRNAVLVARNQEAMEASRRKMQEELNAKAAIFREKQKEQEEEKRRQKIEIWDSMQQGKSYKGTAKLSQTTEEASSSSAVLKPKDKKPLRNADYNPLTGQGGGSCSWRPSRRGPSSGG